MTDAVTLGQLMQLLMRLQADVRAFAEAVDAYNGWLDIPGENYGYCAGTAENIGFELELLRATLSAEHQATQATESEVQP